MATRRKHDPGNIGGFYLRRLRCPLKARQYDLLRIEKVVLTRLPTGIEGAGPLQQMARLNV